MIYDERQWTCDVVHCNAKEREEIGARTPQSTPAGWGLVAIAGVKKHLCPDHRRTLGRWWTTSSSDRNTRPRNAPPSTGFDLQSYPVV